MSVNCDLWRRKIMSGRDLTKLEQELASLEERRHAVEGVAAGRVRKDFQGRAIRRDDKAPCPAPLPERIAGRRHAHSLEARQAGPQRARPDNDD